MTSLDTQIEQVISKLNKNTQTKLDLILNSGICEDEGFGDEVCEMFHTQISLYFDTLQMFKEVDSNSLNNTSVSALKLIQQLQTQYDNFESGNVSSTENLREYLTKQKTNLDNLFSNYKN